MAAKVLRAVHGEEFFGSEDSPICVPGEKSQRYLFSHVATDASLLLAGNTRRAVMAVEKVDRYLVSPQTRCPACWNSLPKEDAENLNAKISTHSPKRLHCWDSPGTIYTSYRLH